MRLNLHLLSDTVSSITKGKHDVQNHLFQNVESLKRTIELFDMAYKQSYRIDYIHTLAPCKRTMEQYTQWRVYCQCSKLLLVYIISYLDNFYIIIVVINRICI